VSVIVPARYYIAALRSIVLKGVGPEVWGVQAIALIIYAGIVLLLATVRMVRSL
jgi:hypothetical protein